MAALQDIILNSVKSAAGGIEIPANIKNQVLGGLSESIMGSLTQTATKAGGIDQIKSLLTGKAPAESSPITALAGNLFTSNIVKKLKLDSTTGAALTGIIPIVMSKLGGILKDQDGDGDVDLQDILITLKGGKSSNAGSILGAATSILGSFLKK